MAIMYTEYHPEMIHFPQFCVSFTTSVLGRVLMEKYPGEVEESLRGGYDVDMMFPVFSKF